MMHAASEKSVRSSQQNENKSNNFAALDAKVPKARTLNPDAAPAVPHAHMTCTRFCGTKASI